MKYLSVCSGIEAATAAWHDFFEAKAFCEYEAFPSAVLAHHYPDVPNLGDLTKWREWSHELLVDADILVGGTPCQAFSVAGLRNSLADDRGNLTLEFVRLADAIDDLRHAAGKPRAIIVWENVPGVLSVKDNAFGCFLAALAGDITPYVPPRGKWTDAGVVDGPQRTVAWRILDAQYFGLAQRRRRVFVVASAREGFDPATVLLEYEGVRRDTAPSREAGKVSAAGAARGAGERSHWDGDFPHPTLNQSAKASGGVGASNQEIFSPRGAYLAPAHPIVMAHGQANAEIRTDGGTPALTCLHEAPIVTHTLKAEGFDASEDGTGRGTPLVPVQAFYSTESRCDNFPPPGLSPPLKVGSNGAASRLPSPSRCRRWASARASRPTIRVRASASLKTVTPCTPSQAGAQHGVAYGMTTEQTPKFAEECALTLTKQSPTGGGQPQAVAYAFQPRIARNGRGDMGDVVNALNAQSGETGKGDAAPCVATFQQSSMKGKGTIGYDDSGVAKPVKTQMDGQMVHQHMAVRRLTPVECERLQGFPDNYTMIPWRNKPAEDCPDGPRYKALGNSMAVPVMRWIGKRIHKHVLDGEKK